ncbi:MAG TPA: proton-conducting transporter membrane subunit [Vicinamibacterales bacterium]|nr:proton-conducting transporter membrane subunit [Vicinamibacterales bacterium]
MTETLVQAGILAGLGGALLSGLVALVAGSARARAAAHALLAIASAAGAAAAFVFLAAGLAPLELGASPLFFGAPLAVDRLSSFFLLLVHLVVLLASWFGWRYTELERHMYPARAVLPLTAIFVAGMQGVLLSTGLAAFLLFWEAMSVASFFLVMSDGRDESRRAALLYLAIAQFGAGALLVGMGLLSGGDVLATFATLGAATPSLGGSRAALATLLVVFAFASKAGLVPLHAWLPEAHPRAPSHVSALMSGAMLKVAVYGLLRFTSACWPDLPAVWGIGLLVLGLGGAAKAAIHANLDRDVKRVLAWSSVENVGLIFAMFGFSLVLRGRGLQAAADVVQAAMFLHILAHALFKSGLFLAAGATLTAVGSLKIEALGSLANRMPRLSAGALALSLAAASLPPFGAFAAEWLLLQGALVALAAGDPAAAVASAGVLLGLGTVAGLAVFAMVRLFGFVFLAEPRSNAARAASEPGTALRGPVLAAAGLVLALGVASPWASPLLPRGIDGRVLTVIPFPSENGMATLVSHADLLPVAGLALALAAAAAAATLAWRRLGRAGGTRRYHTWDCGQPIDASMEYTATAFSAPVRHFLRDIVRAEKHVAFRPVVESNPWIRTGEMEFRRSAGVLERVYYPIAGLIEAVGARLKQVQNGVIQFYIGLILATLLLALWVAL